MPVWNLSRPYYLMDARIGHGIQLHVEHPTKALAVMPELWAVLNREEWAQACDVDEYSLELAGTRCAHQNHTMTRWAIVVRMAVHSRVAAGVVSQAAANVQNHLIEWLGAKGIPSNAVHDEQGAVCCFPRGGGQKDCFSYYEKQPEAVRGKHGNILWYRELPSEAFPLSSAFAALEDANDGCGLSFEMHALPQYLKEQAAQQAQGVEANTACRAWFNQLSAGKAVVARLIAWGNQGFTAALNERLGMERLRGRNPWGVTCRPQQRLTSQWAHFIAYDPWECVNRLARGWDAARYTLTYHELPLLLAQVPEAAQNPLVELENNARSAYDAVCDKLRELSMLAETPERLSELNDGLEQVLPETGVYQFGFTQEELGLLGAASEEELREQLPSDKEQEIIRLMRTAFSMARFAMLPDNTEGIEGQVLTPYGIALGMLYESMTRLYWEQFMTRLSLPEKAYEGNKFKLFAYDYISYQKIEDLRSHLCIDGQKRSNLYWMAWLNIFKPIRYIRNKVHPENPSITKDEIALLYNTFLQPNLEIKAQLLQHAKDNTKNGLLLYDPSMRNEVRLEEFLEYMEPRKVDFQPSLIRFLFMLRTATWQE